MFRLGTYVCYPMHGVGWIEAIEEREVLGKLTRYYVLRFVSDRMTAMVPVETAQAVGLRILTDAGQTDLVVAFMRAGQEERDDNWSKRYRDNMEKLRRGQIYDVADVVRSLSRRDAQKGLSMGERKMYLTARHILLEELSQISGRDQDELADQMQLAKL